MFNWSTVIELAEELLSSVTVTNVSIAATSILACYYLWPTIHPKLSHVPGPRAWPMIGNFFIYIKKGFGPADTAMIKKYGRFFRIYEGCTPTLVIADLEIVKEILVKRFDKFTSRRSFPLRGSISKSLIEAKGEEWRRQRHLLTPAFSTRKVKDMIPVVNRASRQLCDVINQTELDKDIDIRDKAVAYALDGIAGTIFGLDLNSQSDSDNLFVKHANKLFGATFTNPAVLVLFFAPYMIPLLEKLGIQLFPKDSVEFFNGLVSQIFSKTKEEEKQGSIEKHGTLLELMIKAQNTLNEERETEKNKGLSQEEILAQCILFLIAGYHTTANTLQFLLYELSQYTNIQDKLYQEIVTVMKNQEDITYELLLEMPYLDQCVQETLRKYPAGVRLDRVASCDVQIKDLFIPAGTNITIPIHALQNDEQYWPQPQQFDPSRFDAEARSQRDPMTFLPFSVGPRQCLGMRLALIEIKIACVHLLKAYQLLPSQVPVEVLSLIFTQPKEGVWLKLQKREHAEQ